MQFHQYGYVSENPKVEPAAGIGLNRPEELPKEIDVLIVGSGPAGIITAAQLAQFPGVVTRIVEERESRLVLGHADGIAMRSVETFQAFGFADEIINEAYQITEMCSWKPSKKNPSHIERTAITPDDPENLSEFPHMIVNQARVIDYFIEYCKNSPARGDVDYGYRFVTLEVAEAGEYPVQVTLERSSGPKAGEKFTVHAKYVVGADGARSKVRASIGGKLAGDQSYHAWGVMDALAVTDFPDIRKKCVIQSEAGGNMLYIPREGNYLFRMYVDLGETDENDNGQVRNTSLEEIIAGAQRCLHPYKLDIRHVAWHSVYEVAHRVTDRFDDAHAHGDKTTKPRVFLMGDACHTHSAKAGQGMNVSMQDGWNLGWKLGYVLEGRSPENLLESYSEERHDIARKLIEFDRTWSGLMAKRPEDFEDPGYLEEFYTKTWEFPAGFATHYKPSLLTGTAEHQHLAKGFPIGRRFKSAMTTRIADAVDVHIGHHHRADGRYRIYAFADADASKLNAWAEWMLKNPASPVQLYTPVGADADKIFDIKAIYQADHHDVDPASISKLFLPLNGPYQLIDYEKVYATRAGDESIFDAREISREGCVVVVRPDHYVAHVLPLTEPEKLAEFFKPLFLEQG